MEKILWTILFLSLIFFFGLFFFLNFPEKKETKPSFVSFSFEIPNPASVFCEKQGGKVEIRRDKEGNERGYCIFEDKSECEEWDFYYGKCKKGERFCRDFCGDGICQRIVCLSLECPCPETKESCPEDCK